MKTRKDTQTGETKKKKKKKKKKKRTTKKGINKRTF